MFNRIGRILVLFLLTTGLGTTGCSTSGGSSGDPGPAATPGTPGGGVDLEVKNEQRMEAEIWVFIDGARRRLGRVNSFSENTFLIPIDRARILRMEFRLYGGPVCVTGDAPFEPGDFVSYTIPVDITRFDAVCRGDS